MAEPKDKGNLPLYFSRALKAEVNKANIATDEKSQVELSFSSAVTILCKAYVMGYVNIVELKGKTRNYDLR